MACSLLASRFIVWRHGAHHAQDSLDDAHSRLDVLKKQYEAERTELLHSLEVCSTHPTHAEEWAGGWGAADEPIVNKRISLSTLDDPLQGLIRLLF